MVVYATDARSVMALSRKFSPRVPEKRKWEMEAWCASSIMASVWQAGQRALVRVSVNETRSRNDRKSWLQKKKRRGRKREREHRGRSFRHRDNGYFDSGIKRALPLFFHSDSRPRRSRLVFSARSPPPAASVVEGWSVKKDRSEKTSAHQEKQKEKERSPFRLADLVAQRRYIRIFTDLCVFTHTHIHKNSPRNRYFCNRTYFRNKFIIDCVILLIRIFRDSLNFLE